MALVAAGAVRSSPGTTTALLAIGGCLRDRVVVEGDPDGAVLNVRFGLDREPNLASLAAGVRTGASEPSLLEHTQLLPGGLPVVPGLASADRAISLWRSAGQRLAETLAAFEGTVLLDAGRLSPGSPLLPVLRHAACTVIVARPIPEHLYPLAHRLGSLRDASTDVAVVLVGDKPYGPAEVSSQLGVDVLGVLAHDDRAARALAGEATDNGRGLRRSALARSARELAEALVARTGAPAHAAGQVEVLPA